MGFQVGALAVPHGLVVAVLAGADRDRAGALVFGLVCLAMLVLPLGATLASAAAAGIGTAVVGTGYRGDPIVFLGLLVATIVAAVVQTIVVYRYFEPPRRPPRHAFLRSPQPARLGDACLFANMALFQVVWHAVAATPFARVAGIEDAAGRIVFLSLVAGLVYPPPRMLYLVEDLRRPWAWLRLVAANEAMVWRMTFGGA